MIEHAVPDILPLFHLRLAASQLDRNPLRGVTGVGRRDTVRATLIVLGTLHPQLETSWETVMEREGVLETLAELEVHRLAKGEHRVQLLDLAAAVVNLLSRDSRDLDPWEKGYLAGVIGAISIGWFNLARSNLERALVPASYRAPNPAARDDQELAVLKVETMVSAINWLRD